MFSSEFINLTVEGCNSLWRFELGSFARQVVVVALLVVHSYGTSNIAWCLGPAKVRTFPVDVVLNVTVYGWVVTSAVSSPETTVWVRDFDWESAVASGSNVILPLG